MFLEENVTKLIEMGVVDTLLNFINENSATNTPLTHVCVNVLRNFSISGNLLFLLLIYIICNILIFNNDYNLIFCLAQNKKRLGEGQVIPTLMYLNILFYFLIVIMLSFILLINLLAHTNPLVQFAAVVALKNLLLNCGT